MSYVIIIDKGKLYGKFYYKIWDPKNFEKGSKNSPENITKLYKEALQFGRMSDARLFLKWCSYFHTESDIVNYKYTVSKGPCKGVKE